MERRSLSVQVRTSLEYFLEQLQQKLRVNFPNASEAFRFFDVNNAQKCSLDQFVFNCAFLEIDADLSDQQELFEILNESGDG